MRYYSLQFFSGLHVDSKGSGSPETVDPFIRSDTLSAALCLAWKDLYPEDLTDEFFFNPPVRVSSAFPFCDKVLLFPVPQWRFWKENQGDLLRRKEMKKVQWLSRGLMEEIATGVRIDYNDVEIVGSSVALSKQEFAEAGDLNRNSPLWMLGERQRVAVDRFACPEGGQTFFFALQFFAQNSGLYFIASGDDNALNRLERVLDYLGDTGLGADRSSGLGHFIVRETGSVNFRKPRQKEGWISLSLFNPGDDDNLKDLTRNCAYDLVTRSGWISGSSLGRPPIRAFAEGSYFGVRPKGRIVRMLPEAIRNEYKLPIAHSAPRDFRALCMPCACPEIIKEAEK